MLGHAFWGFLFGTAGLYLLAMFSLISPVFELISIVFLTPGRWMAVLFAGPDGSNMETALLWVFNGVLYALLFMMFGALFGRQRAY